MLTYPRLRHHVVRLVRTLHQLGDIPERALGEAMGPEGVEYEGLMQYLERTRLLHRRQGRVVLTFKGRCFARDMAVASS